MFSLNRRHSNNFNIYIIKVGAYYYAMVELKMVSFVFTEMVVTITMMMMMMMMIFSLAYAISSSLSTDEGKALRSTGWWNNSASHHCTWESVYCNEADSVIQIAIVNSDKELGELSKLNFSSFPNLDVLVLYNCALNGSIPQQIGTLTRLRELDLGFNNLTGELPLSLANLSQLEYLALSNNRLHGSIPPEFGKMTNLIVLYLGYNNLTGVIPSSLGNLTNLTYLSLQSNHIGGFIPPEFGKMKNLIVLYLGYNNLTGVIPSSLGNLTNLIYLSLGSNHISGFIPPEIGKMKSLIRLGMSYNHLNGVIPSSLGNLTNLAYLILGSNHISGFIPPEIGKMKSLISLELSYNHLNCVIPSSLGNLIDLTYLNLGNNNISGVIPPEIGKMKSLTSLALSYNHFNGVLPSSIGNLTHLTSLTLQSNQISGFIPIEIGNLEKLSTLDLSNNLLSGQIPFHLGDLKQLGYLNLSYNNFSGTVPLSLGTSIDLSHNQFETQLLSKPLDYKKGSCNEIKGLSRCKKGHQIMLIFVVSISATLLLSIAVLWFLFHKRRIIKIQSVETTKKKNGDLFSIWDYDGVIAYQDIIRATEDFDIRYCIGTGGYGSVYRAQLPSGKVVALKKLHGWESEDPAYLKSFENEVQMLSIIQHRNIVKLHGFCLHNRCMFLVYKYMERGSLFCMLRDEVEAVELDWVKRVNVVKGIANALSYMHHDCALPIIHRDISSNNILLDSNLEAFVSDFSTARLLDPDSSNQTLIAGTYGYIAPGKQLDNNLH